MAQTAQRARTQQHRFPPDWTSAVGLSGFSEAMNILIHESNNLQFCSFITPNAKQWQNTENHINSKTRDSYINFRNSQMRREMWPDCLSWHHTHLGRNRIIKPSFSVRNPNGCTNINKIRTKRLLTLFPMLYLKLRGKWTNLLKKQVSTHNFFMEDNPLPFVQKID